MVPSIWISDLLISERTVQKIIQVHHIDPDELRSQLVATEGLTYSEHIHPEYGLRALIVLTVRARKVLVVLFPTSDPSVWNLGSAYHIQ